MRGYALFIGMMMIFCVTLPAFAAPPLGLPAVPIPADNPQTPEKIALGDKLFNDKRFSTTGEVNCATCHKKEMAFTDQLPVSEGINKLTGTRNSPTVINAAYMTTQFWDGREPSLEEQSGQPFINPVEMGLADHEPILRIVRSDPEYAAMFKKVFNKSGDQITMKEVKQAIASFERTVISGDSPFDRYQYGGEGGRDAAVDGHRVLLDGWSEEGTAGPAGRRPLAVSELGFARLARGETLPDAVLQQQVLDGHFAVAAVGLRHGQISRRQVVGIHE